MTTSRRGNSPDTKGCEPTPSVKNPDQPQLDNNLLRHYYEQSLAEIAADLAEEMNSSSDEETEVSTLKPKK